MPPTHWPWLLLGVFLLGVRHQFLLGLEHIPALRAFDLGHSCTSNCLVVSVATAPCDARQCTRVRQPSYPGLVPGQTKATPVCASPTESDVVLPTAPGFDDRLSP